MKEMYKKLLEATYNYAKAELFGTDDEIREANKDWHTACWNYEALAQYSMQNKKYGYYLEEHIYKLSQVVKDNNINVNRIEYDYIHCRYQEEASDVVNSEIITIDGFLNDKQVFSFNVDSLLIYLNDSHKVYDVSSTTDLVIEVITVNDINASIKKPAYRVFGDIMVEIGCEYCGGTTTYPTGTLVRFYKPTTSMLQYIVEISQFYGVILVNDTNNNMNDEICVKINDDYFDNEAPFVKKFNYYLNEKINDK